MHSLLLAVVLTGSPLGLPDGVPATPAETAAPGPRRVELRQTLFNGLRLRRTEEFEFVERVVVLVEVGQFSEDAVLAVFRRALEYNPRFPFPYFQQIMRLLAARKGLTLP
jgi:hypothetical protein